MSELKKGLSLDIQQGSGDGEQLGAKWNGSKWTTDGGPMPPRWSQDTIPIGVCYAGCMFVCGNVLIGIGDALVQIADNVGMTSQETGGLFLMRGIGQIMATLFCADLYSGYHGNGILFVCCAAVAGLWVIVPGITIQPVLYLWFLATGLMTATLDIGTQILTRRHYGTEAGPWLTANTFCFATAGLLAPLVDYATTTLMGQCVVYGSFAASLAVLTFLVAPDCYLCPTTLPQDPATEGAAKLSCGEKVQRSLFAWLDPVYRNDAVLALMIFFTIGSQNMMSNYLETFILITGVTKVSVDSGLLSAFWGAMVISRLVAMFKLQPGLKTKPLIKQMNIMFLGCMLAAIPLFMTPNLMGLPDVTKDDGYTPCPLLKNLYCYDADGDGTSNTVGTDIFFNVTDPATGERYSVGSYCWQPHATKKQGEASHEYSWICGCTSTSDCRREDSKNQAHKTWPVVVGYMIYGFFVGPILGYIFDFHNRVTVSKERGSAILILGLNLGSSLVPYLFTACLQLGLKGYSMPVVELASIVSPALLMVYMVKKNQATINAPPKAAGAPAPAQEESDSSIYQPTDTP